MDEARRGSYTQYMVKRGTSPITVLVAGLLLAASPLLTPAVLCVGTDGHVAFEPNTAGFFSNCGSCHHLEGRASTAAMTREGDGVDSCGACDDYALSEEIRPRSSDDAELLGGRIPTAVTVLALDIAGIVSTHRTAAAVISRAPPDNRQALPSLRTVVILS